MEQFEHFLQSGFLPAVLLIIRMIVPFLALYVSWRCYTSFKRGQRRRDPVVMLVDAASGVQFPVLYWENSMGRAKSCDICLPDTAVSRDHAVFMRRDEGWVVCDTGSKGGVAVNGKKIKDKKLVNIGDRMTLGNVTLVLQNSPQPPEKKRRAFAALLREAASPFKLMFVASLVHILMALQGSVATGTFQPAALLPEAAVLFMGWGLYVYSMTIQHRVSFEIETVAYLLSGIGVNLLAAYDLHGVISQLGAMFLGIVLFCFLIWFMNDMDRVAKYRLPIGVGALCLFVLNLLIGTTSFGSQNWIYIGPISVQPSEFIKIAFVFVGTSTLDRLQTKKNITEFLVFTGACVGFLFLMRDLGTAVIFFATFLIIAFMRSGSVRTIILILAAAAFGVFLVLTFMPYVADRFSAWGHVWDDPYDTGLQQTRVLTFLASGGLFGMGLGKGYLGNYFAADSDLVFGMLCEEQGLLLGLIVIMTIALFTLYARSDVTRSRSTFFSIGACAVAGMLLFQTCLNVFGVTDILPLTGVTLPFVSAGGSSMASVWGLMAFLKAADERTYAARRAGKHGDRQPAPQPPRTQPNRQPTPRPRYKMEAAPVEASAMQASTATPRLVGGVHMAHPPVDSAPPEPPLSGAEFEDFYTAPLPHVPERETPQVAGERPEPAEAGSSWQKKPEAGAAGAEFEDLSTGAHSILGGAPEKPGPSEPKEKMEDIYS